MNQFHEKVSLREKIGYPLGDFASVLFFQLFMSFLLYFYTDVVGISATLIGTMFLLTRIWDTVNDPMMGIIADRTNTKYGKFRPFLKWLAVPFGVAGFLTFFAPEFSDTGNLVYVYIVYTLMMMAYTAINIPYNAMLGVITPDSKQRLVMSSLKFYGAFSAGFVIKTFHKPFINLIGGINQQMIDNNNPLVQTKEIMAYKYAAGIYALVAIILFYLTFKLTRERVQPPKGQKTSVLQDLKDLSRNRPWIIMFFLGVFTLTSVSIRYAAVVYYFKYFVKSEVMMAWFYGSGSIASLVGIYVVQLVARKIGKKPMYGILMFSASIFTGIFFIFRPEDVAWMIVFNILSEFVMGPTSVLVWAMYADTADWSEWKTGRRATGLVFSAATFSQKMGWTIGGALSGWILGWFGYQANVVQTGQSLLGVKLMISVFPAAGALLAAIAVLFYRIDEKLMEKIEKELQQRRAGSGPAAS